MHEPHSNFADDNIKEETTKARRDDVGPGQTDAYASNKDRRKDEAGPPSSGQVPENRSQHFVHHENSKKIVASLGEPIGRVVRMAMVVNQEPCYVCGHGKSRVGEKARNCLVRALTNQSPQQQRQQP